jgi:hypothetical protein
LTNHPSAADRDAQNKEARQMRVSQVSSFRWLRLVICSSIAMCSTIYNPFVKYYLMILILPSFCS